MDYTYGYIDYSQEIQGCCTCGFEFKNLLLDNNIKDEYISKCPSCYRIIKIKEIDLIVDLRGLKVIKNKLEKRCVSLVIELAIHKILENYIESFPKDIKVSIYEKNYNNFQLIFNEDEKFCVLINNLDIIRELNKFKADFTISKESDSSFEIIIADSIYY